MAEFALIQDGKTVAEFKQHKVPPSTTMQQNRGCGCR